MPVLKATLSGAVGVGRLAWSPEGQRLAVPVESGDILVYSPDTGAVAHLKGHTKRAIATAWSPDGAYIVSSSDDGSIRSWTAPVINSSEGSERSSQQLGSGAAAVFWGTGAILVGDNQGYISSLVPVSGVLNPPMRISAVHGPVAAIAAAPHPNHVAISQQDSDEVVLLRLPAGHTHQHVKFGGTGIYAIHWSANPAPAGSIFAGQSDGVIQRWARASRPVAVHQAAGAQIVSLTVSHDRRLIAYKTREGRVSVHATHDWTEVAHVDDPRSEFSVTAIAFRPGTHQLATLGDGGTVRLWDLAEDVEAHPDQTSSETQKASSNPERDLLAATHHQIGSKLALHWNGLDRVFLRADDYSRCVADVLRATTGEASVAILGHWGRGKTFLAKLIASELQSTHECVWFSAWRYRARPVLAPFGK